MSAIDLQQRTYRDEYHIKRYQCHPEAVRRAYELICFFPDNQRGYASPLKDSKGKPSGWVRVHVGTKLICDVNGFGAYHVRAKNAPQVIKCGTLSHALRALGFE